MKVRMTLAALAAGCLMALGASAAPAPKLKMEVLSSPPQYVTGGDARIAVTASADLHDKLVFWLNGQRIAATMVSTGDRLEGLVSGLRLGPNTLEVRHRNGQGLGVSGAIQLTNHPITGPVFSGPQLKPAPAASACRDLAGARIADLPALTGRACNALYAKGVSPRMAAGAPVTDDVLKCQLKAVNAAEQLRLAAVFPSGVCDHGLPGVSQRPLVGTWLRY